MISKREEKIGPINKIYTSTVLVSSLLSLIFGYIIYDIYKVNIIAYFIYIFIIMIVIVASYLYRNEFLKKIVIFCISFLLSIYSMVLFGIFVTGLDFYFIQVLLFILIVMCSVYSFWIIKEINFKSLEDCNFDSTLLYKRYYNRSLFFNLRIWYFLTFCIFITPIFYFLNKIISIALFSLFLLICFLTIYPFIIFTVSYSYFLEKTHPD